jgi:hypothetical protein
MSEAESVEVDRFFAYLRVLRDTIAAEYARLLESMSGVPAAKSQPLLAELCEDVLFRLWTVIDGAGGPDDFPAVELTLVDSNESLNDSPLHELFYEYMRP